MDTLHEKNIAIQALQMAKAAAANRPPLSIDADIIGGLAIDAALLEMCCVRDKLGASIDVSLISAASCLRDALIARGNQKLWDETFAPLIGK